MPDIDATGPQNTDQVLSVRELTKSFRVSGGKTLRALDGINLDLARRNHRPRDCGQHAPCPETADQCDHGQPADPQRARGVLSG